MITDYEDCEDLPLFARSNQDEKGSLNKKNSDERKARKRIAEETYGYKSSCILKALQSGPVGCGELESMEFDGVRLHRAQAVICTMRTKGHKIETVKLDGVDCYVYRGFEKRIDSKPFKELYYTTSHWRDKSRVRKQIDFFACRQCGSGDDLETHHWRYNLFNESEIHDLITLCKKCHKSIHEAASGSSIHFPATITEEEAKRIKEDQ